jgi:hypothetical protein
MKNMKKNFITKLARNLLLKSRRRKLGNRLSKSRIIENTPRNNGKKREGSQEMKRIVSSLLLLLTIGCESSAPLESEYELDNIWVELDPRLPEDNNGYYHLDINQDSWQTLHRLSGTAYLNGEPLEVLKVHWESSHYWMLGDTLGYIVNRYLTDDGIYVSVDTSYVVGFDGMEVPTINFSSYSNADGEVNTMIAPVRSMVGDTMTIRMYFWNEWDFEYEWESFYIVLD